MTLYVLALNRGIQEIISEGCSVIEKKIVLKLRLQLPHAKLTLDGFGCLV
jgi:hypothetical protein